MDLPSEWTSSTNEVQQIGIIGAGPGGLAALKVVLDSPQFKSGKWTVKAFEASQDVGGVWLPNPNPNPNPSTSNVPPTPLYNSLTTNLPHPLMAYTSFPFPPSTPLFPRAETVHAYLTSYAKTFTLLPYIQFNTRVTDVRWRWESESGKWVVQTSNTTSQSVDLLLICNGHHNVPRCPAIPGLEVWLAKRRAVHSMEYESPLSAPFVLGGMHTVLVVGGGPSGQDIVSEIARVVKKVVHSASQFRDSGEDGNVSDVGETVNVVKRGRTIKFLDDLKGVEFEGGIIQEDIDYVILATGYEVSFPFFRSATSTSTSTSTPSSAFITPQARISLIHGTPPSIPPLPTEIWNTTYGMFPLARYMVPLSLPVAPLSASDHVDGAATRSPNLQPTYLSPTPTSIHFLGLLVRVVPMPLIEVQARAALAAFANPGRVDWEYERGEVGKRYGELRDWLGDNGKGENVKEEEEESIHQAWFRFEPHEQFDYRDGLVDWIEHLEGSSLNGDPIVDHAEGEGPEPKGLRVRRVFKWEREMYAKKDILRRTWRALEASGEAEEWVRGVGEGTEEEWVEVMWKVVRRGEEREGQRL